MLRSQSLRVLSSLAAGLTVGMLLAPPADGSALGGVAAWLARGLPTADVVGTLWTNAIRMTVLPLVAALTITAVASSGQPRTRSMQPTRRLPSNTPKVCLCSGARPGGRRAKNSRPESGSGGRPQTRCT